MNTWMSGSWTYNPVRYEAIKKPSTTIMVGDTDDFTISYPPATIEYRHSEGANFLFCDTHVKWYKEGSVTEDIIKGK